MPTDALAGAYGSRGGSAAVAMARTHRTEPVTVVRNQTVTETACDKCGRAISHDEIDDGFANELSVYLNPDECISQRFRRDYCTACLEPVWRALCKLIDADPEDISGSDFEDE